MLRSVEMAQAGPQSPPRAPSTSASRDTRPWPGLYTALLLLFIVGTFSGFTLTSCTAPSNDDWLVLVGARVAWQLGVAVALGVVIVLRAEVKRPAAMRAVVITAIGALFALNPTRDLLSGLVKGKVVTVSIGKGGSGSTRRTIGVTAIVASEDGSRRELSASGFPASFWESFQERCGESTVGADVEVLEHLGALVEFRCVREGEVVDSRGMTRSVFRQLFP
jgi:hypothetical protein